MKNRLDVLAYIIIFTVITLSSLSPLSSRAKLSLNEDFFQYASRHELVRKSLVEYYAFPLRSPWFGGGFPTLGDPEDPSLNPLVLLSVLFGSVMGLKLISYLALLIGALGTYGLARCVLGYTRWGALFSGLIFGTSLFVPLRIASGNFNEVYAAFLPFCLLLIGLACKGRKIALLILPFVFYTMLSDGKLTFFMGIFYVGVICLLDLIPSVNTFAFENPPRKVDIRPLKIFLIALGITFLIGMIRILPAIEIINAKGGLSNLDLYFYPETYSVSSYKFGQLWQQAIGWKGRHGLLTIGWLPVILFGIAVPFFGRKLLPWAISLALFSWLLLANNAPIDLFKLLWHLPIFNAVHQPAKYFSFQIVFTIAIASGQFFWLLKRLRHRWLEHFIALGLIAAGVGFLYPKMAKIQSDTYRFETPAEFLIPEKGFSNVAGLNIKRNRRQPFRAVTYLNLIRNVGTIDWYTGVPLAEKAIPKFFVDANNNYIPNPNYRGEVFFQADENPAALTSEMPTLEEKFADKSLVGLWHLDMVDTNLARDSSGNNSSGLLVSMSRDSALVKGKFGNALRFNGKGWVDVASTPSLRLDESYTLSAWINAADLPAPGTRVGRFIIDTRSGLSDSRCALLLYGGSLVFLHNYVYDLGKYAIAGASYAEAGLEVDRWHHVAAVFDGTHLRLYVDGVPRALTPYTQKNRFVEGVSLRIGCRANNPQGGCFIGQIDDVAIWNRALTMEEVTGIWSNGYMETTSGRQISPQFAATTIFRPNSITIKSNIQRAGMLVVNQNYHPDWRTNQGELFDKDGLIGLRLRELGNYTVYLRYIPRSFYIGMALSISSLAALVFFCWSYATRRLHACAQHGPPPLKRISQLILWLIS